MINDIPFKSNRNITYSCKYHVVFCPKYRRKVLDESIQSRFKEIATQLAEEKGVEIIEMEVMLDHVHLLCEVDPQYGLHRFVKQLKGRTSRLLRQEFQSLRSKLPTLWTNSYFVSSVGGASLSILKQYIENQKYV